MEKLDPKAVIEGAALEMPIGLTSMLKLLDEVTEFESVTWNVTEKIPEPVGVPEINPVEGFRESPGGRLPEITDQAAYGAKPPLAERA